MSNPKRSRSKRLPVIPRPTLPGTSPGALAVDPTAPEPRIAVIGYGPDDFAETELEAPAEISGHRTKWPVLWINVEGLGE